MMRLRLSRNAAAVCAATLLAGCAGKQHPEPPEPPVRTVTVTVAQPVPCPALAQLGPEPAYPDTDEAIQKAGNLAERAKLYATGRKMRIERLAKYAAAALGCVF